MSVLERRSDGWQPKAIESLDLGRATHDTLLDVDDPNQRSHTQLSPGELVPGTRYQILRWLGEGGMGLVFEAVHVDIERHVALKVLKLGVTPERRASFLAEARACARVHSRFVVGVLDFGVLPDERPFFAMELLGRNTLYSALSRGPLPLERAIPIFRQVCKGIVAVHEAGLMHCDLKPKNVILQTDEGRADTVRIVDFGLCSEPGVPPRIAGTPAYMAPEQIQGGDCDGRVDIYALGCILHEVLTGAPPFEGEIQELLHAHVERAPPAISTLRPDLPAELDAILQRCLSKDPKQRWPNCHELEAALCELQIAAGFTTAWDDLPMPEIDDARRRSLSERMPRPPARRRTRAQRLLVVGAAVLVLAIGFAVGEVRDRPSELSDNIPAAAVETRIDELTNSVRVAASRAHWVYPPPTNPSEPTALHWILELEDLPGVLEDQADVRAHELRLEIADTLTRLGDKYWDEENGRSFGLEYYALALLFNPAQPRASERSSLTSAQLADLTARAVRREFRPSELRAGEIMASLAETDPQRLRTRVSALVEDNDFPLSLQTRDQLVMIAEQQVEDSPPNPVASNPAVPAEELVIPVEPTDPEPARDPVKAKASVRRAKAAVARGDLVEAEQAFNEAIVQDNRSVEAHAGLAELKFDTGEYGDALQHVRHAVRLRPDDAELQMLAGDCYLKVLRHGDARTAYERAEELGHPRAAERLDYLAKLGG